MVSAFGGESGPARDIALWYYFDMAPPPAGGAVLRSWSGSAWSAGVLRSWSGSAWSAGQPTLLA